MTNKNNFFGIQQQQLDGDEEGVESLDQEFRYMPGNAIEDEAQNFTSSRR